MQELHISQNYCDVLRQVAGNTSVNEAVGEDEEKSPDDANITAMSDRVSSLRTNV